MANPEHLAILKQGVEKWNRWRKEDPSRPGNGYAYPDLREADLRGADVSKADFDGTDLCGANLKGANLSEANLHGADLSEANLCEVDLRYASLNKANLSATNLSEANLRGVDLFSANLRRADLSRANLGRSLLVDAELNGANLHGASFIWADLREADLRGVHLKLTDFSRANLSGANLSDADFSMATLGATILGDVDLSKAKGLDAVNHISPSSIGIDTIYKSRGKIPEVFLRGCGVPEEFIAYIGSMVGRPIEFYSCFISYSTHDQEFAERIHADLQDKGVRCWFAPHDIHGGQKIHEQIDEAIRLHDRLLLILSEHSMSSEWVKTELAKARRREVKEGKRVLFPVRLAPFEALRDWECFDSDTGKDSAREVREYFIPDFSNWKDHDSYQAGLVRLVGDLKAVDSG